jgi:opacity protein-like surface antigen
MIGNTLFAMANLTTSFRTLALRPILLGALVFGWSANALAADPLGDVLRGSETPTPAGPYYRPATPVYFRWEGLYFGGQVSYTEAGTDFGDTLASTVANLLRNDIVGPHVVGWTLPPKRLQTLTSFGAFAGYNMQWDDAILGVELNYNRINVNQTSADTQGPFVFNDDTGAPATHHFFYSATVTGSANLKLTDYGTVRMRGGWEWNRLLPYAFAGLAVGRATLTRSVTVSYTSTDIPDASLPPITPLPNLTYGPQTRSDVINNRVIFGYAGGIGIDAMVMSNVFLRAEWEYVQFLSLGDAKLHMNTVRVGAGVKF